MKQFKVIILACLAFGSLALTPSCKSGNSSDDAIDLKLNFKAGDKYLYTTQIDQNIGLAQGISMNQNIIMEMIYNCKADSAGYKSLEVTYDHILMSAASPMGEMKYDSKNPSEEGATGMGMMNNLIGKSFLLKIAPDGEIASVSGLDDIVASFNTSDDPAAQQNVKSQLNDTAIRMMMQNSFDMYPGRKVKVGDTWNKKQQMAVSGINIDMENTYTLKSVADGKATVAIMSNLVLPNTELGADSLKTQMQLNGKQDGAFELDAATGQVINGKISTNITGNVVIDNMPQNISIKGTINVSSKKQ